MVVSQLAIINNLVRIAGPFQGLHNHPVEAEPLFLCVSGVVIIHAQGAWRTGAKDGKEQRGKSQRRRFVSSVGSDFVFKSPRLYAHLARRGAAFSSEGNHAACTSDLRNDGTRSLMGRDSKKGRDSQKPCEDAWAKCSCMNYPTE